MIDNQCARASAPPVRLFCTDLDGTLLGSPVPAARFAEAWGTLPDGERPLLVYNTSRSVDDVNELVSAHRLPAADFIIGSMGTELAGGDAAVADEFRDRLRRNWNRLLVDRVAAGFPGVRPQPLGHLNLLKSSWFWERASSAEVEQLSRRLADAGIDATLVYSCRQFLDIVPGQAGKGRALEWLCRRLDVPLDQVLVCGDNGHDCAMFELPGVRGIVVGNALPELLAKVMHRRVFVAAGWMAEGVIQGLQYYRVFASRSANPRGTGSSVPFVPRVRV